MQITFKLFATLAEYLPADAKNNSLPIHAEDSITPNQLLDKFAVPHKKVHLVLINGIYTPPDQRDLPLQDGDVLAVWPPVAGG